ncbi:MAG: carboxypeptidase-like regulatory domain-containing protein [Planctomycetota bacterium]|nr:carboxypeptidase-like regulatory domain-containing protein [Planctomycetota bacterium]
MAILVAAAWLPGLLAPAALEPLQAPANPGGTTRAHEIAVAPDPEAARTTEPAAALPRMTIAAPLTSSVASLRLELVDERGNPVAGRVEVEWFPVGPRRSFSKLPIPLTEAEGPRIELAPVRAGPYRIAVRGPGLVGEGTVTVTESADPPWIPFVLRSVDLVRGTILDANGAPLEGIEVLLKDDVPGRPPRSTVRTDAAGAFVVETLPWAVSRLYVGDVSYPWIPVRVLEPSSGTRVLDPIRLELYAATFQVLRPDGSPASGARVDGIGVEGGRFGRDCDADGRVHVATLLRGRWRVNAAEASHGRASRAVEVPLAKDEPVVIRLPR